MWNGASLTLHFSIISRPICKFLICRFHGIRQRLTDQIQSFLHQKNETQKHFLWYKHKKMPPAYSSLFYLFFFFSARTPQRFGEIFLARLRLPSWTFLSRFTIVKFPSSRLELQFRIITHCENVFFFFRKFFFANVGSIAITLSKNCAFRLLGEWIFSSFRWMYERIFITILRTIFL